MKLVLMYATSSRWFGKVRHSLLRLLFEKKFHQESKEIPLGKERLTAVHNGNEMGLMVNSVWESEPHSTREYQEELGCTLSQFPTTSCQRAFCTSPHQKKEQLLKV
jgi:hypothetical protein